jgi:hypothetical protein
MVGWKFSPSSSSLLSVIMNDGIDFWRDSSGAEEIGEVWIVMVIEMEIC